ncbi:MAG TPA: ROK family protein [Gemmatimonadaceae bacterium]|nr:ROK family protein [Gemmatimonadaceae bacterium]
MTSDSARYIVGVDLGGTNMTAALMPEDGSRTIAVRSVPTHRELGAEGVVARMVELAESSIAAAQAETGLAREQIVGAGIGAPGPLDLATGVVRVAPNLGWVDFPLRQRMADALGFPTALDNDANCATLGEWWIGAARGARHVVGMTIGTGIGGGLILDGRIYHGASGVAGEVGHTTIDANGRRCACGNYGCLEAYASGTAIAERAREALTSGESSLVLELAAGDPALITAQTVYDASEAGDRLALHIVRETALFLGAGVANLLNTFNPEVVVIAGGVTKAGDSLFEPLRAEVKRRAFRAAVEVCRIVPGVLPGTAGVVGAVAMFKASRERGELSA